MVVYENFLIVESVFSRKYDKKKILIGNHYKTICKQECIPVGCVPAERWLYSGTRPPPQKKLETPPKKN